MGGSSGGGGSSGAVDYPSYLKAYHSTYLGKEVFELGPMAIAALSENPYLSAQGYNPAPALAEMVASADWLKQAVQALGTNDAEHWAEVFQAVAQAVSETVDDLNLLGFDAAEAVEAFDSQMTAVLESKTLPAFRAEMRSINAVQSTAFVIGEALLLANKDREVAKFAAEANMRAFDVQIRLKAELAKSGVADVLTQAFKRIDAMQNSAHYSIEAQRLKIVSMKDYEEKETEYDVQSALWGLEVSEYVNHGIASIAGAATTSSSKKSNPTTSAIGGALVGAGIGGYMAAGTAVGGPMGAAIGGVVGLGAGLLMG